MPLLFVEIDLSQFNYYNPYDLRRANTVNKTLRGSHCRYRTSYAYIISLLVLIPNTRYTPEHQDYIVPENLSNRLPSLHALVIW